MHCYHIISLFSAWIFIVWWDGRSGCKKWKDYRLRSVLDVLGTLVFVFRHALYNTKRIALLDRRFYLYPWIRSARYKLCQPFVCLISTPVYLVIGEAFTVEAITVDTIIYCIRNILMSCHTSTELNHYLSISFNILSAGQIQRCSTLSALLSGVFKRAGQYVIFIIYVCI